MEPRRVLAAAAGYLARTYPAGFALGAARETLAVPRFGETASTAAEGALMAAAIYAAARRTRTCVAGSAERLAVGGIALAALVPVEFAGARWVRGLSTGAYLRSQRSPAGAIFALLLVWFALAPLLAGRRGVAATADERGRALPGDDCIAEPVDRLTHAITIRAPRAAVWPWLAQMGGGRGGWYSYDRLDNGGHRSADAVVPAFQRVAVGDVFPAVPGATDAFPVLAVEPERSLVLGYVPPTAAEPSATWSFVLADAPEGTRLLVRVQGAAGYRFFGMPRLLGMAAVRVVHGIMQSKQLRTIADRVERYGKETATVPG